jgi:hypothetical protein
MQKYWNNIAWTWMSLHYVEPTNARVSADMIT